MSCDIMHYPRGNVQGKKLFEKLLAKMERQEFDDSYLELLAAYQSIYGESERCDIFFAHYLLSKKLYPAALEAALTAEAKRPENRMVWELLIDCYRALGRRMDLLPYAGYCARFYQKAPDVSIPAKDMKDALRTLSIAMGQGDYAPFLANGLSEEEGGEGLKSASGVIVGEYILPSGWERGSYRYWVGIYQESGWLSYRGHLLESLKDHRIFASYRGADTVIFDVIKSKVVHETSIGGDSLPVILPIAGTEGGQKVTVASEHVAGDVPLGKWVYEFLRVEEATHIRSEQPMAVGAPIYLKHDNKRKKLVLNILVDGLCWRAVREQRYELMPHTAEFFGSKGIVFNQHYSFSEFTYPSIATIETGLYSYRHHLLDDNFSGALSEQYVTMSERMKALGYYCVNVMGGGYLYDGILRGHDRSIISQYEFHAYSGIERIIRQIEAFDECDQFVFAHLMDTHPYYVGTFQVPLATETKLGLEDRVRGNSFAGSTSVFLPCTELYMEANRQGIRNTDRCLKSLYDYLREHYDEEEYIIQLYSDHGTSVYDKEGGMLSDYQANAAYMMRGAGIPERGFVEELTSTADIYPALGHLAGYPFPDIDGNLPAALGGKEREYVISSSIYPGQTLKFCIRTKDYKCYLESKGFVEMDGTVDLSGAGISIRRRENNEEEISDPAVEERFLGILREHTKNIHNEGHVWPYMSPKRSDLYS